MLIEVILGAFIGLAVAFFLLFIYKSQTSGSAKNNADLQRFVTDRLDIFSRQLDSRLRENTHAINETKSFVTDRVSTSEKAVRDVSLGLGKLEQATTAIQKTNQEISSFQNMLRHPKIRGGFGEILLTNLLADVLPHDRYKTQYSFPGSSEIVDAIILLQDGHIVAIDAKFPLANYQAYATDQSADSRAASHKLFVRDVKKHISEISGKYISPRHHTLDYAFMYIPVEAVYYEIMVHDPVGSTLWDYCLKHKVIPVSPNSFLAYLQTVLVGLRGMKIEQKTQEILQSIGQLRRDFTNFSQDFNMIGSHINHAKNRYEDTSRRLDRFTTRLEQIDVHQDDSPPTPQIND